MAMKLIINKIFLLLLIMFIIPFINAYVADVTFIIEEDGLVKVIGNTDHPELLDITQTYSFTNKLDKFWYFDINFFDFEKLYYSIILPEDMELNNISSVNNTIISLKNNNINIVGYDLENNMQISIRYSKSSFNKEINYSFWIYFLILILLITFIFYIYLFIINKRDKNNEDNEIYLKNLNQRQKEIISILKKEKEISQNKLLKLINIPKSSLSRNISSLESKGCIIKKRSGLTYIIKIKD